MKRSVVVFGRTLNSARALRESWPELAEAHLVSPRSSPAGCRGTRKAYLESGLDTLSPTMTWNARRALWVVRAELRREGADLVFHILPAGGAGKVVTVDADEFVCALSERR